MADQFWVKSKSRVVGPLSLQQIQDLVSKRKLKAHHQISRDQKDWKPLGEFNGLSFPATKMSQPPTPDSLTSDQRTERPPLPESVPSTIWWEETRQGLRECPMRARIAAIIWGVMGFVLFLTAWQFFKAAVAYFSSNYSTINGMSPGTLGLIQFGIGSAVLFVGGVFLHIAITTFRRRMAGTKSNGAVSIALGVLLLGAFLYLLGQDDKWTKKLEIAQITIVLVFLALLMIAGVLAWTGHAAYLKWGERFWSTLPESERRQILDPAGHAQEQQKLALQKQNEAIVGFVSKLIPLEEFPNRWRVRIAWGLVLTPLILVIIFLLSLPYIAITQHMQ